MIVSEVLGVAVLVLEFVVLSALVVLMLGVVAAVVLRGLWGPTKWLLMAPLRLFAMLLPSLVLGWAAEADRQARMEAAERELERLKAAEPKEPDSELAA